MSKNYSIEPSEHYYGSVEGLFFSPLFDAWIRFVARNSEEIYAERCAAFFESVTPENLEKFPSFHKALTALCRYVADLLEEHEDEFDLGDFEFDEDSDVNDLLGGVFVDSLTFERLNLLSEEECPVAFTLKLALKALPDEFMEVAVRGDEAIYAGEKNGVSPWNDKLLKKKYNYLRGM